LQLQAQSKSAVQIRPITEETQLVDVDYTEGRWEWEVTPAETGDQHLLLVPTTFAADGKTAAGQIPPEEIVLHSKGTFSYYAAQVWKSALGVVSSLQVFFLAVAAIFGAITGGFVKLGQSANRWRKNRKKPAMDTPDVGYL